MVEIPLNLQEDEISVEWNTKKVIWVIIDRINISIVLSLATCWMVKA